MFDLWSIRDTSFRRVPRARPCLLVCTLYNRPWQFLRMGSFHRLRPCRNRLKRSRNESAALGHTPSVPGHHMRPSKPRRVSSDMVSRRTESVRGSHEQAVHEKTRASPWHPARGEHPCCTGDVCFVALAPLRGRDGRGTTLQALHSAAQGSARRAPGATGSPVSSRLHLVQSTVAVPADGVIPLAATVQGSFETIKERIGGNRSFAVRPRPSHETKQAPPSVLGHGGQTNRVCSCIA